jgi:kynurenine formamidase
MDLASAKVYDLGQPYFVGMPHFPTHPPFLYGLTKLHGEFQFTGGGSSAADSISMGTHVGTHIDALNHFSCNGFLYGREPVAPVQSYGGGVQHLSADTIGPIVRRGVLLDLGMLDEDAEVTPADLGRAASRIDIRAGDVVLLRTGWGQRFRDAARYVNGVKSPGPGIAGARWLSERRVFAAGSDTVAFEKVPSSEMAVHVHLLVESGIHIIEVLQLEELAADGVREFTFVAAPLRIEGATGAPVRPLAFAAGVRQS